MNTNRNKFINMLTFSMILNVFFILAFGAYLYHKRDRIIEKLELLGGVLLQRHLCLILTKAG